MSQDLFEAEVELDVDETPSRWHIVLSPRPGRSDAVQQSDFESPSPAPGSVQGSAPSTSGTTQQSLRSKEPQSRRNKRNMPEDEMLQFACDKIQNIPQSDKFDAFGLFVDKNLKETIPEQYFQAQKLILEVIYEGQMRTLSRHSRLLASPHTTPSTLPYYGNIQPIQQDMYEHMLTIISCLGILSSV